MSTYYDKKKLIEDSGDVYISDYDKNLDYSYLSDIIDQKRAYKTAEKYGDSQGMKKANDRANSIRLQAASYTAGDDGSKYNRVKRPYEESRPQKKTTSYEKENDKVYNLIAGYGDFKYNLKNDPLYQTYKDIYLSLGNEAYERALGENSMRTGGLASTSALSAATLAKNKYNSLLAEKIPELYEKAYTKYKDSLSNLYKRLEANEKLDNTSYSRYRDDVKDYENDRDYYYEKDKEINDNLYKSYTDETNLAYDISRNEKEDAFDLMEAQYKNEKLKSDADAKRYQTAVNLAKALYGKTPVSRSAVNSIINMLK